MCPGGGIGRRKGFKNLRVSKIPVRVQVSPRAPNSKERREMSDVIDFNAYKKTKKIVYVPLESLQAQENLETLIQVTPEQLRRFALNLDQAHLARIKSYKETQELIPDYELSIVLTSPDQKKIKLVWHPLREQN